MATFTAIGCAVESGEEGYDPIANLIDILNGQGQIDPPRYFVPGSLSVLSTGPIGSAELSAIVSEIAPEQTNYVGAGPFYNLNAARGWLNGDPVPLSSTGAAEIVEVYSPINGVYYLTLASDYTVA